MKCGAIYYKRLWSKSAFNCNLWHFFASCLVREVPATEAKGRNFTKYLSLIPQMYVKKSLEIILLSKAVSRHFFLVSFNGNRTFSGLDYMKYNCNSRIWSVMAEDVNPHIWVINLLFCIVIVYFPMHTSKSGLLEPKAMKNIWGYSHRVLYNHDRMLSPFSANHHRNWSGSPLIFRIV